jgi:hypothetical protein
MVSAGTGTNPNIEKKSSLSNPDPAHQQSDEQQEEMTPTARYLTNLSPKSRTKFQALIQRNLKMRSNLVTIGNSIDLYIQRKKAAQLQSFYKKTHKNPRIEELDQEIADQYAYIKEITHRLKSRRKEFQEMYNHDHMEKY